MKEHGETDITVDGIVVRNRPRYGSNPEGINRNWEQMMKAASGLDEWILWADADSSFAMTPESLELIVSRMKDLKDYGCIGLAFTISNPVMPYYSKKIQAEINIPFLASESADEIRVFINSITDRL